MPIRRSLARLDGLQRLGAALTSVGEAAGGFPTVERFLGASDAELAEAGLGFKTRTLRVVAEACQSEQRHWDQLDPIELHDAWLTLPGIGPWSAGAAIADLRNAWQLYPHDDLAVRTWATRAFPDLTNSYRPTPVPAAVDRLGRPRGRRPHRAHPRLERHMPLAPRISGSSSPAPISPTSWTPCSDPISPVVLYPELGPGPADPGVAGLVQPPAGAAATTG